jgi:superfamily I DNA/RNA helicase
VELARRLHEGIPPPRIKFLTFTRAATAELAKKLPSIEEGMIGRPSTIHSFSISALLQNPGSASFPEPLRIPDDYERKELIRPHLARQVGVGVYDLDDLIGEMAAKWESLNPFELSHITPETRARFIGAWTRHRRVFEYTLLDELPDLFRCALRDHDDLEGIDYSLLIVDEYQDLNACDLEVIRRLADRGTSILAVGDDDQSIYSFRKAHPAGIRNFLGQYGTNCDYKLTMCHRSPKRIIEWANHVIMGDSSREPRKQPTYCDDVPEGTVALLGFRSEKSEAKGVADTVSWLIEQEGVPPSEILILSRTDWHGTFTKPVKEQLAIKGIDVADPNSVLEVLSDPQNRRLMAILRIVANPGDSLAWWTLIELEKGIGAGFVNRVFEGAEGSNSTFSEAIRSAASNGFDEFESPVRERAKRFWSETKKAVSAIRLPLQMEGVRWGDWIIGEIDSGRVTQCSGKFRGLLRIVDDAVDEGEELGRYLSQIQVVATDIMRVKSEGVRFERMTGSKGLTVTATVLVGVDNDLIPRLDQDQAEERRLLYVAMTRSRKYLFLTWASTRRGPGARSGRVNVGRRQPSEFLKGYPIESEDGGDFVRNLTGGGK